MQFMKVDTQPRSSPSLLSYFKLFNVKSKSCTFCISAGFHAAVKNTKGRFWNVAWWYTKI